MLGSLASMMGACMQDSFDGKDIKCLELKIKIFLNDSATFDTAMKERVEKLSKKPMILILILFHPMMDKMKMKTVWRKIVWISR
jgi:hypothetical protein